MAEYFNKTRGNVTAALRSGVEAMFAPRCWTPVVPEEDGSASLLACVQKGYLDRRMPSLVEEVIVAAPAPVANATTQLATSLKTKAEPKAKK